MKRIFQRAMAPYLITTNEFFISQDGYVSTGAYVADGETYETFVHPDAPTVQLTVKVDTLQVVNIAVGRFHADVRPRKKKRKRGKA